MLKNQLAVKLTLLLVQTDETRWELGSTIGSRSQSSVICSLSDNAGDEDVERIALSSTREYLGYISVKCDVLNRVKSQPPIKRLLNNIRYNHSSQLHRSHVQLMPLLELHPQASTSL